MGETSMKTTTFTRIGLKPTVSALGRQLKCRNTGVLFKCSEQDFQHAKDIGWYEWNGQVVTRQLVTFEIYCRIEGTRRKKAPEFDFRREHYQTER